MTKVPFPASIEFKIKELSPENFVLDATLKYHNLPQEVRDDVTKLFTNMPETPLQYTFIKNGIKLKFKGPYLSVVTILLSEFLSRLTPSEAVGLFELLRTIHQYLYNRPEPKNPIAM